MRDPGAVGVMQGVGDLRAIAQDLSERKRPAADALRERLALDVLHDQVLGAVLVPDVVQRTDVRMRELRDGPRLPLEAGSQVAAAREPGTENLDRHDAI